MKCALYLIYLYFFTWFPIIYVFLFICNFLHDSKLFIYLYIVFIYIYDF